MILRQYITRQVASTTAIVLGFLVVLLLGGRLIRYFGIAAEGRLDVGLLFSIIGYNLPYFLELILPLSFFIALMLVFGRLYVDHEMAVINGSGISRGQLARLMIPLILTLFVIEAGTSLFAKPWGVRNSENIWQQQALSSAFDLIRPQQFISSGNYHLYVGSLSDDNKQLQDVILVQSGKKGKGKATTDTENNLVEQTENSDTTANANAVAVNTSNISESDNEGLINERNGEEGNKSSSDALANLPSLPSQLEQNDTLILAKRAVQVSAEDDSPTAQLDLYQGRRYEIGADSLVYNQVSFERYRISMDKPSSEVVTSDNVGAQPLSLVWHHATQPASSSPSVSSSSSMSEARLPAQAELGYRFSLPWLMIIAPMLAVPLAQVRPRQGRWLRLLPALLIFVSCALVIISLKNMVIKGSVSVWMYAVVVMLFMLFALYLNWASRIHHRLRLGFGRQHTGGDNTTEAQG